MSDSENKTGLSKPSTESIEGEENYQVERFETETSGDGKVPNMILADSVRKPPRHYISLMVNHKAENEN